MTALKSLLYLLVEQNFAFYVPLMLFRSGPRLNTDAFADLAFLLWLPGVAGVLWCFWDFTFKGRGTPLPTDPPKELVATGLYRYVRNPIYVSVLLILIGHFVWFGNWSLLEYVGVAFAITHLFVVFYEEPALRKRFGASYEEYQVNVPRWIPILK